MLDSRRSVAILLSSLLSMYTQSSFASLAACLFDWNLYRPMLALNLGPDFVKVGRAQTLTLLPPFQNHYTSANASANVVDGGIFLGLERLITDELYADFGISGYADGQLTPKGDVWQFGLPEFSDLYYSYHIQHSRVMFTNKLLVSSLSFEGIHPYFSWEIGAAFNRASGYQETSLVDMAVPTAPFANHNQISFTWGVGVGLDYDINRHVRVGVGYQYADLGSASLGLTTAETTTETLVLSNLYTNQVRAQLTLLF